MSAFQGVAASRRTHLLSLIVISSFSFPAVGEEYNDFLIENVELTGTSGSFDVHVTVTVIPSASDDPDEPILVRLTRNGGTFVAEQDFETLSIPSGVCCSTSVTCDNYTGYDTLCVGSCSAGFPPHVCSYRAKSSFTGLALPPGASLLATLDPDAEHVETGPGAASNNTMLVIVPEQVPAISSRAWIAVAIGVLLSMVLFRNLGADSAAGR